MNPMEMLKGLMRSGGNPQEALVKMMTGNNSNPMVNNLIQMAKSGNSKGVENFARNMFKEKGRDFDKEFSEFMQNLKG